MNKKLFAAILFVIFILAGSATSMVYKESEMAHEGSSIREQGPMPDQLSYKNKLDEVDFYQTEIEIPNPENIKQVQLDTDGTLQFPKGNILAIAIHKYGEDITVLEENEEVAAELFQILQSITFKQETDNAEEILNAEQDTEANIVLLTKDKSYALLAIQTYKDGSIIVIVNQEKETRILSAKSEPLRSFIRELSGLKQGDDRCIKEAQEIKFFTNDQWVTLSKDDQNDLYAIIKSAELIPNYSRERIFAVKIILKINGESYNAKVSTEGDVFILEDATFEVNDKDTEVIKRVFQVAQ